MRSARKHLADKTHTSEIIQIKFLQKKNHHHPASYNKFHTYILCVCYIPTQNESRLFTLYIYVFTSQRAHIHSIKTTINNGKCTLCVAMPTVYYYYMYFCVSSIHIYVPLHAYYDDDDDDIMC